MNRMDMINEFLQLFKESIYHLYEIEGDIVEYNVNERCMAAVVFAFIKARWDMSKASPKYHVDFEYNREGLNGVPKELICRYLKDDNKRPHHIIPDLIFHERGSKSNDNNLCIIEFKKFGVDPSDDIIKLKEMTRQDSEGKFKYKIGCHIVFGETANLTKIEVFINGKSQLEGNIENMEDIINESLKILINESII